MNNYKIYYSIKSFKKDGKIREDLEKKRKQKEEQLKKEKENEKEMEEIMKYYSKTLTEN